MLQVELLQEIGTPREEPPVTPGRPPAKGAPAAAPPGMLDLSGMTLGPCPLVLADQAAGAQVLQLHLQSAEPLPDILQPASVAAGMPASMPQLLHLPVVGCAKNNQCASSAHPSCMHSCCAAVSKVAMHMLIGSGATTYIPK